MTVINTAYLDTVEVPGGPLHFAVNQSGALVWANFAAGSAPEESGPSGYLAHRDLRRTAALRGQIEDYAAGRCRSFDVELAMRGTPWQLAVWTELTKIPFGETRSYGEIARALGRPGAARAVGRANGTNTIPLVVPCHRVIGADGTLTGFASGLAVKQQLLEHEARVSGKPRAQVFAWVGTAAADGQD